MAPLLEFRDVEKTFVNGGRSVHAVRGVSFEVPRGTNVALVGESGSGKTTLGRMAVGLLRPTAGSVLVEGVDAFAGRNRRTKRRGSVAQMVFQDPTKALNPRLTIGRALREQVAASGLPRGKAMKRAREIIDLVHLLPDHLAAYPSQLSGGQKQRANIARALMSGPECVVLDEPTAALDMSVRGIILDLLAQLHRETQTTFLLITHDLSIVEQLCARAYVAYRGRIVEAGPVEAVLTRPAHPYTRALVAAIPTGEPRARGSAVRWQDGPAADEIEGCPFQPRCAYAADACRLEPPLQAVPGDRAAACHRRDVVLGSAPDSVAPLGGAATDGGDGDR